MRVDGEGVGGCGWRRGRRLWVNERWEVVGEWRRGGRLWVEKVEWKWKRGMLSTHVELYHQSTWQAIYREAIENITKFKSNALRNNVIFGN